MPQLTARFVKPEKTFKTQNAVRLKVVLTNTTGHDLSVLTWNTPLDGIVTDCLDVSVNGKKVEYDGPMIKRAAPTAKDYTTIKAGESVEGEFTVSDAYDTSKSGSYQVKLKTAVPDVRSKRAKLATALRSPRFTPSEQSIKAKTAFKVEKGEARHLTLGAAARSKETSKKSLAKAAGVARKKKSMKIGLQAPLVRGGTAAKKTKAKQAHTDGYALCIGALAALANDAWFKEWFGNHTATRFNKVKANYTAVKNLMESIQFTYDLTGTGCGSGVFAYTYKKTSTIWFCDQFWAAPAKGTDSKAGTVVHEHTHSDASTDDNQYGQTACRALAVSNPNSAVGNADSHEYFARG